MGRFYTPGGVPWAAERRGRPPGYGIRMADTLRYGVIGTGMMGCEHLRNLALVPGAEVVAFADPHEASRGFAHLTLGDGHPARAYTTPAELLADPDVDAVVVASPNHTHRAVLEETFASGRPVLVEKPLCTTVADAKWAAERAAAHSAPVWIGMEYRYMAPVARALEEVRAGAIGQLRMLAIREHRFPFLPKVADWNRFARNTGGTLVEKCCHFFDLMRLFAGDEAVRVYASAGQDVNHRDERYDGERPDILDNAFVVVDFAGGARALLDLCMFAEGSRNQEEISATGDAGKVECFVPSSDVVIGKRHPRSVETVNVPVDAAVLEAGYHHGSTYVEHLRFYRAVTAGGPVEVTAEDGLRAVAIGVAAERSAVLGEPVDPRTLL
jgi:myo-inositol 2-dehydrogenase/D-chiro-inositol 1-dehydrogenase